MQPCCARFLMTSQVGSHGTTDIKLEMLSGAQTGNGIQHHIHGIVHVHTYRKDNIFIQRRLLLSVAPPTQKKESNSPKICPCRISIQRFATFFKGRTKFEIIIPNPLIF